MIEPNEVSLGDLTDHGSAARRVELVAELVHVPRGGFGSEHSLITKVATDWSTRCSSTRLCSTSRASFDPHASLTQQAQAVAVERRDNLDELSAGPPQDASFVRFRELSFTVTAAQVSRAPCGPDLSSRLIARAQSVVVDAVYGADPEVNIAANADPVGTRDGHSRNPVTSSLASRSATSSRVRTRERVLGGRVARRTVPRKGPSRRSPPRGRRAAGRSPVLRASCGPARCTRPSASGGAGCARVSESGARCSGRRRCLPR